MKCVFRHALAIAIVCAGTLNCGDDTNKPAGIGSVSGKVTFLNVGSWPATGNVQVSVYSSLPANHKPNGAPDAFTNPITAGTTEYNFKLEGLDPATYAGVLVSWREPANPSGAKLLGFYWINGDSLAVDPAGDAKEPGPAPVGITTSNPDRIGLDITADIGIVP